MGERELAGLPVFAIGQCKELESKIAELSEEIEELQFEEKSAMRVFDKTDAAGMKKVEGEISKSEARIVKLDAQEVEFTGAINREKEKFDGLKAQVADIDQDKLADTRFVLRQQMENEGRERIRKSTPDGRFSFAKYQVSVKDADKLLSGSGMAEQNEERKRMEKCHGLKREARKHQRER